MQEPNSPELYDESLLDSKMEVIPEDAERYTRLLAEKEGLFVGISSGAALSGAIRLAATLQSGVIVVIFPDRGEKYLSTNVFVRDPAEEKEPNQPVAGTESDNEQIQVQFKSNSDEFDNTTSGEFTYVI